MGGKIVYSRADAIIPGQSRNHYREAAVLLAVAGEILPKREEELFYEW